MRVGIVIIGRNEGDRFRRCLASVAGARAPIVYVDSGSTDGSVSHAREAGAHVVELDPAVPFTAARARNAGRDRLAETDPDLDAIQVIDGDCELHPDWIATAVREMSSDDSIAVVAGRRRERHPEQTIYNRVCDLEWAIPPGNATYFGGDALIRLSAFDAAGGYNPAVIAGEEPDLAWRMRERGKVVRVLDADMTTHDADITRFGQWWRRAVRAGHAHIAMAVRHGWRVTPYNPAGVIRTLAWSIGIPMLTLALAVLVHPAWAALLLVYSAQWIRLTMNGAREGLPLRIAAVRASFYMLSKWPETAGYVTWAARTLRGRDAAIIEYKGAPA